MKPKEIENLSSLSTEIAKEIVDFEFSEVKFTSLSSLSSRAAAILSKTTAAIELSCINSLTVEAAEALIPHTGQLKLQGITELETGVALMLAKHKGPLDLSGLKQITVDIAEALSSYKGDLNLSALSGISADVARILANHEGDLKVNGLTDLSDVAAEFLAQHRGPVHLDGIQILSSAASEFFGGHDDFLSLNGITKFNPAIQRLIEFHEKSLSIKGLVDLNTDHIKWLISMRDNNLIFAPSLLGVFEQFNEAKSGKCNSQIRLAHNYETGETLGKSIPMAVFWYSKAAEQGNHVAQLKKCLLEDSDAIDLSSMIQITDEESRLLAECDCDLTLNGLKELSDESARFLSQHKRALFLDGVTRLSDVAIEFLSNHPGSIHLKKLNVNTEHSRNVLFNRTKRLRMRRTVAPDGFVTIPEGQFTMGGPVRILNRILNVTSAHWPAHTVYVSKFYIAKHQVTKCLWNQVRDWGVNHGYVDIPYGEGKNEDHPVHSISWYDCVKWCNARSEMEWLNPCYSLNGQIVRTGPSSEKMENTGIDAYSEICCDWNADAYRLPSEAEWEKSARGGLIGKLFPNGNLLTHNDANFNADESNNFESKYHPTYKVGEWPFTSPVGSFAANEFGIFDIVGNVGEVCWDLYYEEFYKNSPTNNPHGPSFADMKRVSSSPMHGMRVTRSGSYSGTKYCNNVYRRSYCQPTSRCKSGGFRLARSC